MPEPARAWLTQAQIRQRGRVVAAVVALACALPSAALVWRLETARLQEEKARAYLLATERAQAIQSNLERAFSAAFAIAALVRQGQGRVPEFSETARQLLPFYPGVASLQLARNGVVSQIVPLAGNEQAIGHDLLADPRRNKEAVLARATGQLTLAGPFELLQGGLGAAARLPVFLEGVGRAPRQFWGFAVVLMRFPQTLEPAQLDLLVDRGFHYRLWRLHPDTQALQVIAASTQAPLVDPVRRDLTVPNATWHLDLSPGGGWRSAQHIVPSALLAALLSLLLAWLARLLLESRLQAQVLEHRVQQRTQDLQRFSEVTAHHLQEPARRLAQYAERLKRQLDPAQLDAEAGVSLTFIGEQARQLKAMLAAVERYLAADQPRAALQATPVQEVLDSLQRRLQEPLQAAAATLTSDAPLPTVWIDRPRLADMLEQAVLNALRFATPPDGQPLQIRVQGRRSGAMVQLRVCDNGPGIAPDYRERVFRVFERLGGGHDGHGGLGVGLAIIRRIAHSCAGRAWIEAAAQGGCCVVMELPHKPLA